MITTAALLLESIGVSLLNVNVEYPPSFRDIWEDLVKDFPSTNETSVLSFTNALKLLVQVMQTEHDGENEFQQSLFNALQKCFCNTYVSQKGDNESENFIFLQQEGKYGFGIAHNVDCTRGLVEENAEGTSSGLSKGC